MSISEDLVIPRFGVVIWPQAGLAKAREPLILRSMRDLYARVPNKMMRQYLAETQGAEIALSRNPVLDNTKQ